MVFFSNYAILICRYLLRIEIVLNWKKTSSYTGHMVSVWRYKTIIKNQGLILKKNNFASIFIFLNFIKLTYYFGELMSTKHGVFQWCQMLWDDLCLIEIFRQCLLNSSNLDAEIDIIQVCVHFVCNSEIWFIMN